MGKHLTQTTITVTSTLTFAASDAPDVECPFEPEEWLFIHTGTGGDIDYSFDGQNVHGTLRLGEPDEAVGEICNDRKVWFKRAAAGAGTSTVKVQASASRAKR